MMKRNTYDPVLGKMRQEDLSQLELKLMRTKLNQKSDVGHTHSISDITDLITYQEAMDILENN